MRVLLIEDDPTIAKSIERALTAEGFPVDTIDLAERDLEIHRLFEYEVVLLDLNLPDRRGFDLLAKLRAAKLPTPILLLSGMPRKNQVRKCKKKEGVGRWRFIT